MTLLCVDDLAVTFETPAGSVPAVRNLGFRLERNQSLGVVGESGSGKSQAMAAILGLLAENGRASGSVRLDGEEILNRSEAAMRQIRGRRIAIVFQDPMTALNPYRTIGDQLQRVLVEQRGMAHAMARPEVVRMLDAVQVPGAKDRLSCYPHEFSGGMRQRVLIAAAMLCRPDVLIADEPTTALDVTVQAGILALLRELQEAFHTALVLISHDLAVVSGVCERLLVMQNGACVEEGATSAVFEAPAHPQTRALLDAVPRLDRPAARRPARADAAAVLRARSVQVRYPMPRSGWIRRAFFTAVHGVDLDLHEGETVGVVGESGCGKSSFARALLDLDRNAEALEMLGQPVAALPVQERRALRRDIQLVFQDPLGSLDPRMSIEDIVAEPLRVHGLEPDRARRRARVEAMLHRVGLDGSMLGRYPHEFSGGQCQRIGIARALMTEPGILVCDEAVSALDVTVQAEILSLLSSLQREFGLAIVFIAHDLAVVRAVSDRVLVMYLGRVVESGPVADIYERPAHPYTQALLASAPVPVPARRTLVPPPAGDLPPPWAVPDGCPYRTRCPRAGVRCSQERPEPVRVAEDSAHTVACFFPGAEEASNPGSVA